MCNLFINFLFLLHLTGRQVGFVQADQLAAGFLTGKWLMQIPCSLLGSNTCAPVLCCLLPLHWKEWKAFVHYIMFSIWVAAEVPQHREAQTVNTNHIWWFCDFLQFCVFPWSFTGFFLTSVIKQRYLFAEGPHRALIQLFFPKYMSTMCKKVAQLPAVGFLSSVLWFMGQRALCVLWSYCTMGFE